MNQIATRAHGIVTATRLGESQQLVDAVMDHCAEITLQRIRSGDLCLVPARF